MRNKLVQNRNRIVRRVLPWIATVQSLLAFSVRYRLPIFPIFFCENREYGQRVTESLLQKFVREVENRYRTLKNGKS
jgi:hypothetical protein